jgi:isoleucyl-tRNA synthetase
LRRSAQTAFFNVLKDSLALMAPILPFTTEEAWESLPAFSGKEESVHLETFPAFAESWLEGETKEEMDRLISLREAVLKELERAREEKLIGNSLEAEVHLRVPAEDLGLVKKYEPELGALFIVSAVSVDPGTAAALEVRVGRAAGAKCPRCWNYSTAIESGGGDTRLCLRCRDVVRKMAR